MILQIQLNTQYQITLRSACLLKVDNLFKIVLNPEASFEQYEDDDDDFLDDENEDYSYHIKYIKILRF